MDNKTIEYDSQTYNSFYKGGYVYGRRTGLQSSGTRTGGSMATNIGQKFTMTLAITWEKGA